jgi:hypothetical protein
MQFLPIRVDYPANAIDFGISRIASAEFTHLRISAPADNQSPKWAHLNAPRHIKKMRRKRKVKKIGFNR